ncbi:hypothetical protein ABKN59_001837 [Abortiporus biennis]
MPQARMAYLDALPAIPPVDSTKIAEQSAISFNRLELGQLLGGAIQGVIGCISKDKPRKAIAVAHNISEMIYPQRDPNCWLPQRPGEHGYMFVGIVGPGRDHERYLEPVVASLFIPSGSAKWHYFGEYEARRCHANDISREEWLAFPEELKQGYAETTLAKSYMSKLYKKNTAQFREEVQAIRTQYDNGDLSIPCVALRCLKYDENLVPDLKAASGTLSAPQSSDTTGKGKRKCVEQESASTPPVTKRVTLFVRDPSDSTAGPSGNGSHS